MGEAIRRASTGDSDAGGGAFTACFIDASRVGIGGGVGDFFSTRGEIGGGLSVGGAAAIG